MRYKSVFIALLGALMLSGCSVKKLEPDAKSVRLYFDEKPRKHCKFLGEVIGTHGNIVTFLFIPNEVLMQSAVNELKNKTKALGGDAVYLMRNQLNFSSSVTMIGQAYRCADIGHRLAY